MTYEDFLDLPATFIDDIAKLVIIKNKYRLKFTEEEKQLNDYMLTYWEEMKINELRYKFERCWEIEE